MHIDGTQTNKHTHTLINAHTHCLFVLVRMWNVCGAANMQIDGVVAFNLEERAREREREREWDGGSKVE